MSKWIVDIHGDIEGDYEIIEEYKEPQTEHWILADEQNKDERMTREEAKQAIDYYYCHTNLLDEYGDCCDQTEYEKAFDMAIKALEAWDEVQKEIYREIDALDEIHEFRNKKAYFKTLDIVNKYQKEVERV